MFKLIKTGVHEEEPTIEFWEIRSENISTRRWRRINGARTGFWAEILGDRIHADFVYRDLEMYRTCALVNNHFSEQRPKFDVMLRFVPPEIAREIIGTLVSTIQEQSIKFGQEVYDGFGFKIDR